MHLFAASEAGRDVTGPAYAEALGAARVLRGVKGDRALIDGFDEDVRTQLVAVAVHFQSLVMIVGSEEVPSHVVQPDEFSA